MSEFIYEHVPSGADATGNPVEAPTLVQHEEIVRCRDCEYYATDGLGDYCTLMDFEDVKGMADRFCAWGVRKVDA